MTSSKKGGKLKKADVLALLDREIKPDFDASSPASSVASGSDTLSILASDHLSKAHVKKLQGKTAKLIEKRTRLDNAVDEERALLSGGKPTARAAASPAWSRNMDALLERVERLSAKEMAHMADLAIKLDLVEKALAQKVTNKKRKAVETMRKIHEQFREHLEPYHDQPMNTDRSDTKNEEDSDEDVKMDEESLNGSDKDEVAENAKMTLEKEFERATRHVNLDDYDPTEVPSDVEEAIMRSAAKSVMTGGFMPINSQPYHSHATANHGFNDVVDDDPFFGEEKSTPTKSKKDKKDKKKDKKRKRESVTNEAVAEAADDEHETPRKKPKKTKSKKAKKLKSENDDAGDDIEQGASPNEHSLKKAKKAKKSKKDRDTSPVWTVPRRYSTSVIPLPVFPPQALADMTQSASKQITAPAGPPVPVAAPVAPNSGRRRSFGPFSSPKKRVFSSIRNSPPPVMGVATPERKKWILEGDTSRALAKSTTGKVTMTIGAHPPILSDGVREASPAEAAGQKRRPGRPKGSKTQSRKAVIAGSPPLISTTPIPLPAYASRAHDEDLVRMVIPDALGRPVLASSPRRGSMTLEDRLQQDRAMYAEERARWFQLMGIPDPAARF